MRAIARHRTAAVVAVLLASVSLSLRASGQERGSFLDLADGAIARVRDYCAALDGLGVDEAIRHHNKAIGDLVAAQAAASAAEDVAARAAREAERALETIRRTIGLAAYERRRDHAAAFAKRQADLAAPYRKLGEIRSGIGQLDAELFDIGLRIWELDDDNARRGGAGIFSTPPEVRANNDRIRALTAERAAKEERKRALAADTAQVQSEIDEIEGAFRERNAEIFSDRANERLKELDRRAGELRHALVEKRSAYAQRTEERLRLKDAWGAMEDCMAARMARPDAEEPATTTSDADTPRPDALPPAASAPPPAVLPPRPSDRTPTGPTGPGTATGGPSDVAGADWPGSLTGTCRVNNKDEPENGVTRARFTSPDRLVIEIGPPGQKNPLLEPQNTKLDSAGRFSIQYSGHKDVVQFKMAGRFEFQAGADGKVRPSGHGTYAYSVAWWVLGGFGGQGVTTPEQREFATQRCQGTWALPPNASPPAR